MKEENSQQKGFTHDKRQNKGIIITGILVTLILVICVLMLILFNKEAEKYTITFETNSNDVIESIVIDKNNTIAKPEDPIKEKHEFVGWYHNDQLYDFNKPVTSDIKLEAKWSKAGKVSGVKLDKAEVSLYLNDTAKLTATVIPENAKNQLISWKSSNPDIVSVDSNGNIKALKEGTAIITVTTEEGQYTAKSKITVKTAVNTEIVEDKEQSNEPVINSYKVTFEDEDGTMLSTIQNLEKGSKIAEPTEPTKKGHTFEGWYNGEIRYTFTEEVNKNITLTAKWTKNKYAVTFVNYDGTLLESKIVEYGEMPIYTGKTPEKPSAEQYECIFVGWTPNTTTVEQDVTYTAMYLETIKKYEVTFIDGTVSNTKIVEYGRNATEPEKPTKEGHTFEGWYNGETRYTFTEQVKENITLTAKWTKNKYTVIFVNYDGEVLQTKTEEYGVTLIYTGETPTKPANNTYTYSFKGWDKELSQVKENVTYTATFDEKYINYVITFLNEDGTQLEQKLYHYGDIIEQKTPTKPSNEQYTYIFTGWTPSISVVEKDQTYTATYTSTINKYEVIFKDEDGTILSDTQTLEYGSKATEPEEPTKEGYTFEGWYNGETKHTFQEEIKGNVELTAKWSKNKYTITFVNYDGTTLEEKTVEYGETPTYTAQTPKKASNNTYIYLFNGWDKELTQAKENVTYTATFTEIYINYVIIFQDEDGREISKKTYHYGEIVEQPENPSKPADAQYTYTFAGWTPSVTLVEKDQTYTATYTSTSNKYEVIFKDENGTILSDTQTLEYGSKAAEPEEPTKEGYTFEGWYNGETKYTFQEEIKGNVELTAKWSKNKYTITFVNYDGTTLEEKTVGYGEIPTYTGETPTKPSDNTYTYLFGGWDRQLVQAKENVTYAATFTETYIEYVIIFADEDGREISNNTYHYGETVQQPENPTKLADAQYTYTFAGWIPSVTLVEKDQTYTATYTSTVNKYEVIFKDEDGTILSDTQTLEYGSKATEPETPTKKGHTFEGWYNGETKYTFQEEIKGNVELAAKWSKNKYTITFVNYDGTVLETYTLEYGTTPVYTGETPTKQSAEQCTYTFAGWTPSVTLVEKDQTYIATYTSTVNKYTITFVNYDGTVLETHTLEYGTTPVYTGETPIKPSDSTYSYTFTGWSPSITIVETHMTYEAVYKNFVDVDLKIEEAISGVNAKEFDVTKTGETINVKFTSYTENGVTVNPPYDLLDLASSVVGLFDGLSSHPSYKSVTADYKGNTIDLKNYEMTDAAKWLAKVCGKSGMFGLLSATTDDLKGKTITIRIELEEGEYLENGKQEAVYKLTFS